MAEAEAFSCSKNPEDAFSALVLFGNAGRPLPLSLEDRSAVPATVTSPEASTVMAVGRNQLL